MPPKPKRGASLLEMMLVIGLLGIIAAATAPITLDFYYSYLINTEKDNLISLIRKSQQLSMTNDAASAYGIYIGTSTYTLFRGASYAGRTPEFDEMIIRSGSLNITGPEEFVFVRISGRPAATGTITISDNKRSYTLDINKEGMLNW